MNVERSVTVAASPQDSFDLFTLQIGRWWPLHEGFSYGGDRTASIHLEPVVGGRFFERFTDGDELQVGTVVECGPPHRIVFTWTAPDWPAATEVRVDFLASAEGTRVTVEHRAFERLGPAGPATRDGFAGGWPTVLDRFATAAAAATER